jgi:hypothetical protein
VAENPVDADYSSFFLEPLWVAEEGAYYKERLQRLREPKISTFVGKRRLRTAR